MKLFISQPMQGRSNEEIEAERKAAIDSVMRHYPGEEIEVIDSFFKDKQEPDGVAPGLWFLGESIKLLSTAHVAYFCNGWENARGCRIENEAAIAYGLDVIEDYSKCKISHRVLK